MPIKGLSDRNARFPRLGIIAKGAAKGDGTIGSDLDYFRLRGTQKNPVDSEILKQFHAAYGSQPKQLNVFIPQETVETAFEAWMEEWGKSGLMRRCDRERQHIIYNKSASHYSADPIPCDSGKCKCKQIGRLQIVIPEIQRFGYFEVQTHSKHDIMRITEQLLAIEQAIGTLRGIPFWLRRIPDEISCPMGNGRSRQVKWLLQIEAQPAAKTLMIERQQQRLFGASQVGALPASSEPKPINPNNGFNANPVIEIYPSDSPVKRFWDITTQLGYKKSVVRNWLQKNYKSPDPAQMNEEALLNAIATLERELIN